MGNWSLVLLGKNLEIIVEHTPGLSHIKGKKAGMLVNV